MCAPFVSRVPGFPNSVVGVLMDFLNGDGAMDVILFVRSIVEQYEVRTATRCDVHNVSRTLSDR